MSWRAEPLHEREKKPNSDGFSKNVYVLQQEKCCQRWNRGQRRERPPSGLHGGPPVLRRPHVCIMRGCHHLKILISLEDGALYFHFVWIPQIMQSALASRSVFWEVLPCVLRGRGGSSTEEMAVSDVRVRANILLGQIRLQAHPPQVPF